MKALSVRMPWAWLICAGLKDVENRAWRSDFRGRIYIHAGKRLEPDDFRYVAAHYGHLLNNRDREELGRILWGWFDAAIIGEVDIVDCVHQRKSPWFTGPFAFVLANPRLYDQPIPYRGQLGFFSVNLPGETVPASTRK